MFCLCGPSGESAAAAFKNLDRLSEIFQDQLAHPLITAAREGKRPQANTLRTVSFSGLLLYKHPAHNDISKESSAARKRSSNQDERLTTPASIAFCVAFFSVAFHPS